MLLQKPGWRVKNLITLRKNDTSISHAKHCSKSEDTEFKVGKQMSGPSANSATGGFPLLRQTSSNLATRIPHIATHPPSRTGHSSAISSCCCDCGCSAIRDGLFFSPPTNNHSGAFYASKSPIATPIDGQMQHIVTLSQESSNSLNPKMSSATRPTTINTGPMFKLFEPLSIDVVDHGDTQAQSREKTEQNLSQPYPDEEKLIRGTDEAFRAVLAGAGASGEEWYGTSNSTSHSEPPKTTKKTQKLFPNHSTTVPALSGNLEGKRYRNKQKTRLQPLKMVPPPSVYTSARWTLNEVTNNVVDVFSGKRFRMEVDEMLTPDRVEELKKSIKVVRDRRASMGSAPSIDTQRSTISQTLQLESLSRRMTAAQNLNQFPPSPARAPPAIPKSPKSTKKQKKDAKVSGMTFTDFSFPTPPRTPGRSIVSQTAFILPTISEVSPFILLSNVSTSPPSYGIQQSTPYKLLPSTRFTLVAPLNRQGPIRIECPLPEVRDRLSPEEDSLDWTAFQMAISGMHDGSIEDEGEEAEAEVDDIMSWWGDYGFQGYGSMQRSDPGGLVQTKQTAARAYLKQLSVSRNMHCRAQMFSVDSMWRQGREDMDTAKIPTMLEISSVDKRKSFAESMPPSPMLELIFSSHARNEEVIPMGFNLGHDLGDFLSWETSHVQSFFWDGWHI